MSKQNVLLLALAIFIALNVGVFLIRWQSKSPDLPQPIEREVTLKFEGAENPIQTRIDRMVTQLRTESLEQSLAALPACEFYRWPGSIDPTIILYKLPFERELGSNSVKEICNYSAILKFYLC